jgi:hypothetical protein
VFEHLFRHEGELELELGEFYADRRFYMSAVAPQAVGGQGVIPFQAAAHNIIFDAFTTDTWTPGAAAVNLFNGGAGAVKPYGYLANLWLKLTTSGGTAGTATLTADSPWNAIQTFRFVDPNGHAIIDCDGYGLYLLNKYGARYWIGDPIELPLANATGVITWRYSFLVPLQINPELGIGAIPNMDSSGPYRIQVVGNTVAAMYVIGTGAAPLVTVAVGGEFLSLPDRQSRVTGQPQMIAPPGLDRGYAIVGEYTKQTYAVNSGGGQQTIRLTRVGNIIRQLFLVARSSTGVRLAWDSAVLAAGTQIGFAFDTVPLWQADPLHVLEQMARRRDGVIVLDTGVLVVDFATPAEMAVGSLGMNGGFDSMIQTAQSSALELSFNFAAGMSAGVIEVYTSDVTITSLTGQPYSFAFAGQLLAPTQPSLRS